MSASSTAARARSFAKQLFESRCSIAPRGTEPVTDPNTGEVTFPAAVEVYSGPCRVRPSGAQGATTQAGGAELFTFDYLISIPFAEADVIEGHRVTISTSPDPALVGIVVEVQKVDRGEHITARRLFCNEVS